MKSKERAGLTPIGLRKKAADFARNTVSKQSDSFRRYGVWGDFEKPYLTLQPEYEAAQIEVCIYHGRKERALKCVHGKSKFASEIVTQSCLSEP